MTFDPDATQRAMPPAEPTARLKFRDLLLALLLISFVCVLLADLSPVEWVAYYATRLWLPVVWLTAIAFGSPLLGDRGPWLARATRLTRHRFMKNGGGAYGMLAVAVFAWLEWQRVLGFFGSLESLYDTRDLAAFAAGFLDFGLDSLMNAVWSVAWPAFWKMAYTAGQQWPAVAVAWLLYEATHRAVPLLPRRGTAP